MILYSLNKMLLPVTKKVELLSIEYSIRYISCVGSLAYLLSTRVDSIYAVHKLEKFSSNTDKLHFECLVHLLVYIRGNKNLG